MNIRCRVGSKGQDRETEVIFKKIRILFGNPFKLITFGRQGFHIRYMETTPHLPQGLWENPPGTSVFIKISVFWKVNVTRI